MAGGSEQSAELRDELAEILSIAAHELRTPSTVILGLASTLAAGRTHMTDEQVGESIVVLDRQAHRLVGMLQDLLDVTRIRRGRLEIALDSIDLSEAIAGALAAAAPPENVHVSVAAPAGIAVLADRSGLDRILVNLLTNAYRYGGNNVRVEAHHVRAGVRLSVVDDGPGVPAAVLPHLFEPFRGEVGGTGLGLSIVRGLAEAFGGSIGYQKESPSGARFDLIMRAGSSETDIDEKTDYAPSREVPVNILIVDDEPDVLFLLRITLESAGYNVSEAAHGREALEAVRAAKPNLLVTDLMMPVMDGRELIRHIREEPEIADIPIMLLSANPPKVSGADVIMQKPFAPKELMRVIDEMVSGAE
jgi:CheY-like chemotaxis protein